MFYYLLARNVNIMKNTEQVASITIIKYIIFLAIIKVIEYRYFEIGFFNLYVLLFLLADIVFSLYHYYSINILTNNQETIFWNDDIINENFSESQYKKEIDEIRNDFAKRKFNEVKINNVKPEKQTSNLSVSSEIHTDQIAHAINKIISEKSSINKTEDNFSISDSSASSVHNPIPIKITTSTINQNIS
jgi:hypothetical protein